MAPVKMKEEQEMWDTHGADHIVLREFREKTDLRDVQSQRETGPYLMKDEPEEEEIKATREFPLIHVSVKSEEEEPESFVLHQTMKVEPREDTDGEAAGLDKRPESGEHCEISLDTDDCSGLNIKEETEEVMIKSHEDCPYICVIVKSEDVEEGSDEATAAGLDKHAESEEHGENSSDTDDSEDWTPSAERPTPQTQSEGNREDAERAEQCCSSDSEWSWEFNSPTKTPARDKRKMEDYSTWTRATQTPTPQAHSEASKQLHEPAHRNHVRANSSDTGASAKKHICSHCGKGFGTMSKLRTHEYTHTGQKPFKCSTCEKCFILKHQLNQHVKTHTELFKCSVCALCFTRVGHLTIHMRTHTGERPFKCSVCAKAFTRVGHLNIHVRSHTGEKPFKCAACEKCFAVKLDLKRHMRTHTGEKPFKCTDCEKYFASKLNLSLHMRTHTGERPFKCAACEKCFIRKYHLSQHVKTHGGEKPFKCSVCEKCFTLKHHLNLHVKTHAGERPFRCAVCAKCFTRTSHLYRHMSIHTGEQTFRCSVCSKYFKWVNNLKRHMKIHSGQKEKVDVS